MKADKVFEHDYDTITAQTNLMKEDHKYRLGALLKYKKQKKVAPSSITSVVKTQKFYMQEKDFSQISELKSIAKIIQKREKSLDKSVIKSREMISWENGDNFRDNTLDYKF